MESLNSLEPGDDDDLIDRSSPPLAATDISEGLRAVALPHPPLPVVPTRPRPLPPPGHRSTVTAFTSYVRRRGEPDGRTANAGENAVTSASTVINKKVREQQDLAVKMQHVLCNTSST